MTAAAATFPAGNFALAVTDPATGDLREGYAWESLPESPFRRFVAAICAHLAARPGDNPVSLTLLFRPMVGAPVPIAAPTRPYRLQSPWLTVTDGKRPDVTIIWSERQFLLDQALLAGAGAPVDGPPISEPPAPLAHDVFDSYVRAYTEAVLQGTTPAESDTLSKRIPPDLLWLFRHSVQSTRAPFSTYVIATLERSITAAAPGYTALIEKLLDHGLASSGGSVRYASILELQPIIEAGSYQLDRKN